MSHSSNENIEQFFPVVRLLNCGWLYLISPWIEPNVNVISCGTVHALIALTFESVDEAVLSCGAVYYTVQGGPNFRVTG